jgi:hypothetical protein
VRGGKHTLWGFTGITLSWMRIEATIALHGFGGEWELE